MAAEASKNLFTMSNKDFCECFRNIRQKVAISSSLPQPEEETEEQKLSIATPKKTPARAKTARKDRRTFVPAKNMTQQSKPTNVPKKKWDIERLSMNIEHSESIKLVRDPLCATSVRS